MDVKPPNNQISTAVPAQYQRSVQILRSPIPRAEPVSPEDIVDCVEIKSESPPPSANRPVIKYGPIDRSRSDKGAIIDIWI